jgi:hypothetical protein
MDVIKLIRTHFLLCHSSIKLIFIGTPINFQSIKVKRCCGYVAKLNLSMHILSSIRDVECRKGKVRLVLEQFERNEVIKNLCQNQQFANISVELHQISHHQTNKFRTNLHPHFPGFIICYFEFSSHKSTAANANNKTLPR